MIANRTFQTALVVLGFVKDVPFEILTSEIYIYCKDSELRWMTREFEAQIELAGANPERFIFQLHKFYNDLSRRIRKENLFAEMADLLGLYMELSYTHSPAINQNIVDAYTNLIMQTTEYLRPNKFDLTRSLCGVTTDGEPLYQNQFIPFSDEPLLDLAEMDAARKKYDSSAAMARLRDMYERSGYRAETEYDFTTIAAIEKYYVTTRMALFPYMNEYTCDIFPQNQLTTAECPLLKITASHCSEDIRRVLTARRRTVPSNGVRLVFDDPCGELREMLIKETVKNNTVVMLYKLTLNTGDYAGYYNTRNGFLYSMAIIPKGIFPDLKEAIETLFLYCYALCVTNQYPQTESAIMNGGSPVPVKIFNIGGKPKNMYNPDRETDGAARKGNPDYSTETAKVEHYIRKLPTGQKASQEAVELARQMGYCLDDDQTYVRPFCKTVFVKNKE